MLIIDAVFRISCRGSITRCSFQQVDKNLSVLINSNQPSGTLAARVLRSVEWRMQKQVRYRICRSYQTSMYTRRSPWSLVNVSCGWNIKHLARRYTDSSDLIQSALRPRSIQLNYIHTFMPCVSSLDSFLRSVMFSAGIICIYMASDSHLLAPELHCFDVEGLECFVIRRRLRSLTLCHWNLDTWIGR